MHAFAKLLGSGCKNVERNIFREKTMMHMAGLEIFGRKIMRRSRLYFTGNSIFKTIRYFFCSIDENKITVYKKR